MSTLKVDTLDTSNGTGNITFSRPIVGDGSNLTGVTVSKAAVEALGIELPAANLTGTIHADRYTDTVYTHPTTAGNKHIPTAGATDQVLTYSSSGTAAWADPAGGGKVLQSVFYNTATQTDTNTAFPFDNTIPQISEGTEILSQAFTPESASSNIFIQAKINYGMSTNARIVIALFTSASTNALSITRTGLGGNWDEQGVTYVQWMLASGSTSARTYSVRLGTSGTSYYARINKTGANSAYFGTANNSNMLIMEIES